MASGSAAYGVNGGFNQSGGAYYIVVTAAGTQLNAYTPGTGSGGAATAGTLAPVATTDLSNAYGAGKLIKDMGKTVVSSGRVFRKFQPVITNSAATFGVGGDAASGANPGYFTAYLEMLREGQAGTAPVIARYA
jgi:hypothetical protein